MDGTLIDSAVITVQAFGEVVPACGFVTPPRDSIRAAIGYPNPEFYFRLFPDSPKAQIQAVGERIEAAEQRILKENKFPLLFPGCRELLETLCRKGYTLYIASTGSHEHVHSLLEAEGVTGLFAAIFCGRHDKADMLAEIVAQSPGGWLMVGDMEKDSDSARENGLISVGACYGHCQREYASFDYYIDNALELLTLLKNGEL